MNSSNKLGLQDNPVITGLWQVADLERDGKTIDQHAASDSLLDYVNDGFTCFDMADHYGSAELIAGFAKKQLNIASHPSANKVHLYTKWCPEPHETTYDLVKSGVMQRIERLGVECIDLLQLHWWTFDHPGYIDVMDHLSRLQQDGLIRHLGVTNFDTDHLHVLQGQLYFDRQLCRSETKKPGISKHFGRIKHTNNRYRYYHYSAKNKVQFTTTLVCESLTTTTCIPYE